jgi:CRP-like cAMP-binding protein
MTRHRFPHEECGWGFLARLGLQQSHPRGAAILRQGSPSRDSFLIETGLVKIVLATEDDRERIVDVRSPGSALGVCDALLGVPYAITVKALTDCACWRVRVSDLQRAAAADPAFSRLLHEALSREIRRFTNLIHGEEASARRRFERLLARVGQCDDSRSPQSTLRVHLPLKLWELAELLAITPAHLSRLLHRMESEGALERRPGHIFVWTAPPKAL